MSDYMNTIYDKYVAEERLKNGTKFERLAAIVYKHLDKETVVIHDMCLRGDGKTAMHQIDVLIEKNSRKKRVLVECKNYSDVVGIGVIRDFYGAVHQLKPDEAIVVSSKGFTKGAQKFAKDEGIRLAVLREFRENDWQGRIKRFILHINLKIPTVLKVSWIWDDPETAEQILKAKGIVNGLEQEVITDEEYFYDRNRNIQGTYHDILDPLLQNIQLSDAGITNGQSLFRDLLYVDLFGQLVSVKGFEYELECEEEAVMHVIDDGHKVALLIIQMLDSPYGKAIFDTDLEQWTFDTSHEVIQKDLCAGDF